MNQKCKKKARKVPKRYEGAKKCKIDGLFSHIFGNI